MFLLFFILIQSQQSARLSPLVIAAAVLAFILGVGLLVYFFRRLKASEKEAEEEWSLSRRSLFVSTDPDGQKAEGVAAAEPVRSRPLDRPATESLASVRTGEIHEAKNEQVHEPPPATKELRAEYFPAPKVISEEAPAIQEDTLP